MTSLIPPGVDLSTIPIVPPPSGISSNFVNPDTLANPMMYTGIAMVLLAAFVVIVRLFINYHATRGLGWDDCSSVIATVLLLIYVVSELEIRGSARHSYDIPISLITPSLIKFMFLQTMTLGPMIFFAKLSLFLLYHRLFRIQKSIRYAIIFGIIFSFLNFSSQLIVSAIFCTPKVGHPWDLAVAAKCSRGEASVVVLGVGNLILDIYLLILPIPVILPLKLSVKKKIGVFAIFMAGLFILIASIISLIYRAKLWRGSVADTTWNSFTSAICTMIETGVIIMCSSTSALVAFWKSHIATYVTPFYSHFCSQYSKLATRFNFVSRTSSSNQIRSPKSNQSKPYPSLYNLNYVELDEHRQEPTGFPGSIVRTEIGGGSSRSEVEAGVIRKLVKVEQTFN